MGQFEQNSVTDMMGQGIDLAPRWKEILEEIALKAGFVPDKELLRQSEWWKSGKIGAVHCPGVMRVDDMETKAVLKIQGTKPATSEVDMIREFENQNGSKVIRPPKIYWHSPWNEDNQYEAFILEMAAGQPVIINHPATEKELSVFFNLYSEYRENCMNKPWVGRPEKFSYREQFSKWMDATNSEREHDLLKEPDDMKLAEKGIKIIEKSFTSQDLEFMHGHFQPGDLVVDGSGKVVLFSNLFWSYRIPFYDAVFGYHWWLLGTEHAENFSGDMLEEERKHWLDKIYSLGDKKRIELALLERAVPALMVDRYLLDQSKPSAEIITIGARKELKRLIGSLS